MWRARYVNRRDRTVRRAAVAGWIVGCVAGAAIASVIVMA